MDITDKIELLFYNILIKYIMGFEFYIIDSGNNRLENLYLSYNWGDLKNYWYIHEDLFNQSTNSASLKIKETLEKLQKEGYVTGKVDKNNKNWGWGTDKEGKNNLPSKERIGVFMYHLESIKEKADIHPDCFFRDEQYRC